MRILSDYKDIYLEFLKDTQAATEPQIKAFFEKYDQHKDTHTFESIHEALAHKKEVYYLDLSKKDLAVLPVEITSFPNLLALDLSNNFIKDFAGLEQLDSLEVIFIENAELRQAPLELAQLSKLTSINLNNNRIVSIPDSYFELPLLTGFNLDHNNIEHVPTSIQHARSLTGFYLDENKLDTFPTPTCYAPALKILTLNGNRIHQIPRTISRLKGLVYLSLSECGITSIPIEFCELEQLETLKISSNKLTKIPEEIGNLKHLKNLTIEGKVLKRIPSSITDLPRLEHLKIKGEQLVELPDTFDRLENLKHLTIEGSPETNIPHSISGLRKLKLKELSLFNLSIGSLPDLSNCTLLEALYLGSNKISHIPPTIGSLVHLQSLILWNNELQKIPTELGNLSNLITLNLGKNQLQSFPVELTKLRKLSSFRFDNNPMAEMKEIRGMGIDEVFDYLKRLQGGHYRFNWEMPKALTIIIQQYLDFFPEFTKRVIGKEINLSIQRTPIGLKISIDLEGDISIDKINELLRLYIKCAKESIEGIFNGYPKGTEDELFILKLEHQIGHLKQQLRFLDFENKVLKDHLADYKRLLPHIKELFELRGLSIPSISLENINNEEEEEFDKVALKNLVANNELSKVLAILEKKVPETRTKLYNMVIGIYARLNKLKLDVNTGLILRHEANLEENALRHIILGIIDEL